MTTPTPEPPKRASAGPDGDRRDILPAPENGFAASPGNAPMHSALYLDDDLLGSRRISRPPVGGR